MTSLWAQPKTEYYQLPKITKSRGELKLNNQAKWDEREGNYCLHNTETVQVWRIFPIHPSKLFLRAAAI